MPTPFFRKASVVALSAALMFGNAAPALAADDADARPLQTQSGTWHSTANGGWWFVDDDEGTLADGLYYIDGTPYVFNEDGWMLANQWVKLSDGHWYWCGGSGAVARGWRMVGGRWYYFDPSDDGAMYEDRVTTINGATYRFSSSGAMYTGWYQKGAYSWEYYLPSGARATGWHKIGGYWYYFEGDGLMAYGMQTIGGTDYYFETHSDSSFPFGSMAANRWVHWYMDDGWSYYLGSGAMAKDQWVGNFYIPSSGIWQAQ